MAEDYRIAADFPDHPKTVKLMGRLGADGVVWLLHLWGWARRYRPKGILTGMNEDDIRIAAKAPVGSDFVQVAIEFGFIDRRGNGRYALHNWQKRNGFAYHSDSRSNSAKKAATQRWAKGRKDLNNASRNADSQENYALRNAPSPSPYPIPNPVRKASTKRVIPSKDESVPDLSNPLAPQFAAELNRIRAKLNEFRDRHHYDQLWFDQEVRAIVDWVERKEDEIRADIEKNPRKAWNPYRRVCSWFRSEWCKPKFTREYLDSTGAGSETGSSGGGMSAAEEQAHYAAKQRVGGGLTPIGDILAQTTTAQTTGGEK